MYGILIENRKYIALMVNMTVNAHYHTYMQFLDWVEGSVSVLVLWVRDPPSVHRLDFKV
jgi:hypothetical protein